MKLKTTFCTISYLILFHFSRILWTRRGFPGVAVTVIPEWLWQSDHQQEEREVAGGEHQRRMEHPHGPGRGHHLARQGRSSQPAEVATEEDHAGASARQVQVLRKPRDPGGELDWDEQTHGPGAEEEEGGDLVSHEAEEEAADNAAEEAAENQDQGTESVREEHATESSDQETDEVNCVQESSLK